MCKCITYVTNIGLCSQPAIHPSMSLCLYLYRNYILCLFIFIYVHVFAPTNFLTPFQSHFGVCPWVTEEEYKQFAKELKREKLGTSVEYTTPLSAGVLETDHTRLSSCQNKAWILTSMPSPCLMLKLSANSRCFRGTNMNRLNSMYSRVPSAPATLTARHCKKY